jgi:hypothetical protein
LKKNENDNNDEGIENESLLSVNASITEDELQTCEHCHRIDVYVMLATEKDRHYQ